MSILIEVHKKSANELLPNCNYNSIDLAKLLMSICVVAIHTNPLADVKNSLALSIYDSFVNLAVPFFFIASGFLMATKFDDQFASQLNYDCVKMTLSKILKMYIRWTIIYLPITIYHFATAGISTIKCILYFIRGLLLIGEQYNSWHLWYLLSTIYALILILLYIKLRFDKKKLAIAGIVIAGISIGISYFVSIETENFNFQFLSALQYMLKSSIANGRILRGAFYIPLGIVLQRKSIPVRLSCPLFFFGFILNVLVESSVISSILYAFTTVALFELLIAIKLRNARVYTFVRRISTVVYFIHMYIWTVYYMLIYGKKTYGVDCFLVTAGGALLIATIYVYYERKKQRRNQ